ncbi:MAG: glycosyltransferase family 4 protein [Planctomycetales bacterium]|nr:glycosyltransferase family 4 protein [Planctomycetales bacterium]
MVEHNATAAATTEHSAALPTAGDVVRVRTRKAARLTVRLVGDLVAMVAPGGGEVQLQETARALRAQHVDARLWRPWEDHFEQIDIVHLFGSTPGTATIAEAAKRAGKPVVLSPISWFDPSAMWRELAPLATRASRVARWWLRRLSGHRGSWRRRLYHSVDALLPNSMAEASQLAELFGVPWQRLHVVPNAADGRFANADPQAFVARYGVRDFVLCAGRIEPRKNQAALLRALADTDVPVVILGAAVPGQESYYRECRRQANGRVTFIDRLEHDDPLLAAALAAARCLVLCSWFETPGLVALEAALSGTPLVLTRRGSASEYFGPLARYVDPANEAEIRSAVTAAYDRPQSAALAELVRTQYSWQVTAQATRNVYDKILG